MAGDLQIKNKRAYFEFHIHDKYVAGIELLGTEIKSIRAGKANITDGYCAFTEKGELQILNMHIAEYNHGTYNNHIPTRVRKLLLQKKELVKIKKRLEAKGYTIVPLSVFISDRGFAKMEIGVAEGKKLHDKRDTIKDRDVRVDTDRQLAKMIR